jgi:hypothetical protein
MLEYERQNFIELMSRMFTEGKVRLKWHVDCPATGVQQIDHDPYFLLTPSSERVPTVADQFVKASVQPSLSAGYVVFGAP